MSRSVNCAHALSCTVCEKLFSYGESYQITTYCGEKNLICLGCVPNLRRCESCDRPESPKLYLKRISPFGYTKERYQCELCARNAINNSYEAQRKLRDCMNFLKSKMGLNIVNMDIPLLFSDNLGNGKAVECIDSGACAFFGDGQCSTRVVRKLCESEWYEHTREVVHISVLSSLHEVYLGRTLCHELIHCWLALNMGNPCMKPNLNCSCQICPRESLEEDICEGLCELAALLYLQHRAASSSEQSFHTQSCISTALKGLEQNTIQVYNIGLEKVRSSLRSFMKESSRVGKIKLIELDPNIIRSFFVYVVLHRSLPRVTIDPGQLQLSTIFCRCDVCGNAVCPESGHAFSFVVNGLKVVHVECFRKNIASRCEYCRELLLNEPVISGQHLHERCFLAREKENGDICTRCNKPLWEKELPSSKNNNRGSFVRRTSRTMSGEIVHHSCGDRCKFCNDFLADFPAIRQQMLHKKCFLPFHKQAGDICKLCGNTLWVMVEKTGGFARKTMKFEGSEVHCSCIRCVVCKDSLGAFPAMSSENCHIKCYIKLTEMKGEICHVCKTSLWERNGASFSRNAIKDLNGTLVHQGCGPKCSHCNMPLLTEEYVRADKASKLYVHSKCFVEFHSDRGDRCKICSKPLWERSEGGKGFQRRSSYYENQGEVHTRCLESDFRMYKEKYSRK